jgi:hypothetical protein
MREHERLIARIRQIRRRPAEADQRPTGYEIGGSDELRALEARITHLERLVEGLQDSVHRESLRVTKRIGELDAQVQPAAFGRALSEDARERGL